MYYLILNEAVLTDDTEPTLYLYRRFWHHTQDLWVRLCKQAAPRSERTGRHPFWSVPLACAPQTSPVTLHNALIAREAEARSRRHITRR